MYEISAHAVRDGKTIEVTITGKLSDSCHQAKIEDIYPGGNRVYITDPGAAQVFIAESLKPGSQICLFVLVPWFATTIIPDKNHDKVEIYLNNKEVLEVEVTDVNSKFIVIAPIEEDLGGCSILPEDSFYPAIYKKVYGPAAYDDCKKYVQSKCQSTGNREKALVATTRK